MSPYDTDGVVNSLRGQELAIVDLNAIFSGWPRKINANLDRLRQDVDAWLERHGTISTCRDSVSS